MNSTSVGRKRRPSQTTRPSLSGSVAPSLPLRAHTLTDCSVNWLLNRLTEFEFKYETLFFLIFIWYSIRCFIFCRLMWIKNKNPIRNTKNSLLLLLVSTEEIGRQRMRELIIHSVKPKAVFPQRQWCPTKSSKPLFCSEKKSFLYLYLLSVFLRQVI